MSAAPSGTNFSAPEAAAPGRAAWLAAGAVALLAIALYLPSLGHGFIWDDPLVLDRQLPYFDGPLDAFFPSADVPQWSPHYYRPVVVLSYLVDDALVGSLWPAAERAAGRRLVFHATPILGHGVASALVVVCALEFGRRRRNPSTALAGALGAGVLFAVHPVHVEPVAWLAGRSDVLCAVFFLAAVAAFQRWLAGRHTLWLLACGAAALAAMLSKEVGFALVALLPLLALLPVPGARPPARDALVALAPALGAALVALVLRAAAATPSVTAPGAWPGPSLAVLSALGWYGLKVIWPVPFSAFVPAVPDSTGLALAGLVLGAAVLGLVALALARRTHGAEAFAGALFLLTLAPALVVAVRTIAATPLAERYLYLPSAGIALLAGFLLERAAAIRSPAPARRVAAATLGPVLLVALVAAPATVLRQQVWRNDLAFWTDAAARAPGVALVQSALGTALVRAGQAEAGEARFRRALEVAERPPERAEARANLGSLFAQQRRWDEAIAQFRAALADGPQNAITHANLAQALLARYAARPVAGEKPAVMDEAARHLDAARRIDPRNATLQYNYGMLLLEMGRGREAEGPLREVIALAPDSSEAAAARRLLPR